MKYVILILAALLFGCENSTSSNPTNKVDTVYVNGQPNIEKGYEIKGVAAIVNGGKIAGGAISAKVCLKGKNVCTTPDVNGNYSFAGNTLEPVGNGGGYSARISEDSVVLDTVVIKDPQNRIMREIPIHSWRSILPEFYIVQRDVRGSIISKIEVDSLDFEAVYWNLKDSIAYVLKLEVDKSSMTYSGFIYMPYDDKSFTTGEKNRSLFSRAKYKGKLFGATKVTTFSERFGDVVFDGLILSPFYRDTISKFYVRDSMNVGKFDTSIVVSDTIVSDTIINRLPTNKWIRDNSSHSFMKYNIIPLCLPMKDFPKHLFGQGQLVNGQTINNIVVYFGGSVYTFGAGEFYRKYNEDVMFRNEAIVVSMSIIYGYNQNGDPEFHNNRLVL